METRRVSEGWHATQVDPSLTLRVTELATAQHQVLLLTDPTELMLVPCLPGERPMTLTEAHAISC